MMGKKYHKCHKYHRYRGILFPIATRDTFQKGFSLIEMLVVMFVFSILAVVSSQVLTLSLRGTRKSESVGETRQNAQYALDVIDRLLKNARSLTCSLPAPSISNRLDYVDQYGNASYFECISSGSDNYIASNSATRRLTSNTVTITNCNQVFSCTKGVGVPDTLDITISAASVNQTGAEAGGVTLSTKILLRNY